MAGACGSDIQANAIITSLTGDADFDVPNVNLDDKDYAIPSPEDFGDIARLTNDDLTTRIVGGAGTFDALMDSMNAHLRKEYEANRISGQEYTKAYIGGVDAALGTAAQYLLGQDNSFWQAVLAREQAHRAKIETVTAKLNLATAKLAYSTMRYQSMNAKAEYALTKLKLASEDANYCMIKAQTEQVDYTNKNLLPSQKALLLEQIEVQRAQTNDTRLDGSPVFGSVGKQKELWTQQIISYKRDTEIKTTKLFTDAWITMKTMDEGLLPPTLFQNHQIDIVLNRLLINTELKA